MSRRHRAAVAAATACLLVATAFSAQTPASRHGIREPAFSPDGRRIAVSWLGELWTMTPDGRDEKKVVARNGGWLSERDPAWSPDGTSIALSADVNGEFDIYIAPAGGGAARRVTSLAGDERWPSWTRDGRLVFSHRQPNGPWQIYATKTDGNSAPVKLTPGDAAEWHARVSSDGKAVAFISDRDREPGDDADVFVRELAKAEAPAYRVTRGGGAERFPAWAPDSARVSYTANRGGEGPAVWVTEVPKAGAAPSPAAGAGRGGGAAPAVPIATLVSRRAGTVAWSPDSETLLIATIPGAAAGYRTVERSGWK